MTKLNQGPIPSKPFSKKHREQLAMGKNDTTKRKGTAASATITVVIRKRPITDQETQRGEFDMIECSDRQSINVNEPRRTVVGTPYIEAHSFTFDRVYSDRCRNVEVYGSCVRPLVCACFEKGGRSSVFAYGQTGSGKTYTMLGSMSQQGSRKSRPSDEDRQEDHKTAEEGVVELALRDIFSALERNEGHSLYVSVFEIYCNKVYDLLNGRRAVKALESRTSDGVIVKDLSVERCKDPSRVTEVLSSALVNRVVGANSKNTDSSRGHVIATFELRTQADNNVKGKLAFIDLAGSERGADTLQAGKMTQQDGAGINRSLLALKECIRAIDAGSPHVPFRDSELTKVLRDLFVSSCARTVMIANISPASGCCEQTLNSLRYAERVRQMRRHCAPEIVDVDECGRLRAACMDTGATVLSPRMDSDQDVSLDTGTEKHDWTQNRVLKQPSNDLDGGGSPKIKDSLIQTRSQTTSNCQVKAAYRGAPGTDSCSRNSATARNCSPVTAISGSLPPSNSEYPACHQRRSVNTGDARVYNDITPLPPPPASQRSTIGTVGAVSGKGTRCNRSKVQSEDQDVYGRSPNPKAQSSTTSTSWSLFTTPQFETVSRNAGRVPAEGSEKACSTKARRNMSPSDGCHASVRQQVVGNSSNADRIENITTEITNLLNTCSATSGYHDHSILRSLFPTSPNISSNDAVNETVSAGPLVFLPPEWVKLEENISTPCTSQTASTEGECSAQDLILRVPSMPLLHMGKATSEDLRNYLALLQTRSAELFAVLHSEHYSAIRVDTRLCLYQGTLGKHVEMSRKSSGLYDVSLDYVSTMRRAVETKLLVHLRLGQAILEMETLLLLKIWIAEQYKAVTAKEVEFYNDDSPHTTRESRLRDTVPRDNENTMNTTLSLESNSSVEQSFFVRPSNSRGLDN